MSNHINERRRSAPVTVSFTPADRERIRQAAAAANKWDAAFCRDAVLEKIAAIEAARRGMDEKVFANQ